MFRPSSLRGIPLCLVLPSICAASATVHAAEPEEEAVHLDYVAEGRCPSRGQILSDVEARADGWQIAEPNARARRFVLRIEPRDGVYIGRLEIHSASGEVSTGTEIRGPDCSDVALGLTVAVALALDPRAGDSSPQPLPPTGESKPPRDPTSHAPPPNRPGRPGSSTPPTTARPASDPDRPSGVSGPHVGLGARIEVSRGVAGTLVGASLFGELAWETPFPWLAPKARLGGRRTLPTTIDVTGGHVDMTLSAAFVELCPVALALGPRVEASACLQGSVGALSAAAATEIPAARDEQRLWLDYGVLGAVRLRVGDRVSLDASVGLTVPITRHRIRLEPDELVSRAGPLVFGAGAGMTHRF